MQVADWRRVGAVLVVTVSAALGWQQGAAAAPVVTPTPTCGAVQEGPHTVDLVGTGFPPGSVEGLRFIDADGGIHQLEVGPPTTPAR